MSSFKEMVEKDIRDVFLCSEEFAQTAKVEGKLIEVVVDNNELKERQGGQDLAVAESASLFYAKASDLPTRRAAGASLNVNGRECIVDDWSEDMGMATVVLRENIVT